MLEYLISNSMVCEQDRIAVGVSGGADSMVLLWSLIDKQKQVGFYFEVININHHLRGKESDGDSKFVEEFCKKRKIPVKVIDVDVKSLKNDKKTTLEESARIARYDAFYKTMKQDNLNKLFLAHHKNDQAETILMHIFRGSGISGAAGIKKSNTIFRPLLDLKKSEILQIAKDYKIEYVLDSTNADNDYSRNYLRNVVIPEVEKIYPSVIDSICLFGKRCDEILDYIFSKLDYSLIEKRDSEVLLKSEIFAEEKFIAKEYMKIAFDALGVFADIEAKHFALIYDLSKMEVNKELDLPHNIVAKKTYGGVKLYKKTSKKAISDEYQFVKSGEFVFHNLFKVKTELVEFENVVYGENALYVDASKVSTNAVWRTRKLGDKFSRIGTGAKKLNDYFTNNKVDHNLRDNLPLLALDDKILVVLGEDVSEYVKIDSLTDEIVKITFERI